MCRIVLCVELCYRKWVQMKLESTDCNSFIKVETFGRSLLSVVVWLSNWLQDQGALTVIDCMYRKTFGVSCIRNSPAYKLGNF